jgi:hypothetical protein
MLRRLTITDVCGTQAMANVTVTPGKSRPIDVLVQLEDEDEKPLAADTTRLAR